MAASRPVLPDSAFSGPVPWVIAIMMFLTVLAAAAALGLSQAASHLRTSLSQRLTVQIVEADREARDRQSAEAVKLLKTTPGVTAVRPVSEEELARLMEPWLGEGLADVDLPVPAMVDVDIAPGQQPDSQGLEQRLRTVAPSARVEDHGHWLAPLDRLMTIVRLLALSIVLLMGLATAFVVVLAARAALNTHRETIDVMVLLGATDRQVAALFQRRIALDAISGGAIGYGCAILVLKLLEMRINSLGSEVLGAVSLSGWSILLLALLPLAGMLLAMGTARRTILSTVGRIL